MSSTASYYNTTDEKNITNTTWIIINYDSVDTVIKIWRGAEISIMIFGTFINLWFIVPILRSRELRSRLRNKIICSMLLLHLVDSALVIPGYIGHYLYYRYHKSLACPLFSFVMAIQRIQDSITNWQLVILIAVFIAQIVDFNPKTKLSARAVNIGTWALLIIPWVVSVLVVPSSSSTIYRDCFWIAYEADRILRILDTALPLILSVLLVIVAVVLRYIRFNRGRSRSMGVDLMCQGAEIDSSHAYIVAVVVSVVCDLIRLIYLLDIDVLMNLGFIASYVVIKIGDILSDGRVILMVFPWLLLPDIRERIKTWRPWYRPGPGLDVTMTYKTDAS